MTEQQKRVFATTYVHLILNGRRTIEEVPAVILDIVKADLGITE
ncbi:CD1375 family protein [Paenibacillus sp. NPDC093718]